MAVATVVLILGFLLDQSLLRQTRENERIQWIMEQKRRPLNHSLVIIPVELPGDVTYNRIGAWTFPGETGTLMELGVYDQHFQQCVSTGVRAWPDEGPFQGAIPEWTPQKGSYYLAVSTNNPRAAMAAHPSQQPPLVGDVFPLEDQASVRQRETEEPPPLLSLLPKTPLPQVVEKVVARGEVFAMCRDPTRHRVYGQRGDRVLSSADCGKTWRPFTSLPPMKGHLYAMAAFEDRLYALSSFGELFETQQVLSQCTERSQWKNITCPEPLRRNFTGGMPYGLVAHGGQLYLGEYTTTARGEVRNAEEDKGACRILRYAPTSGEWAVSGEFKARHIHAFHTDGPNLWVSIGDLNSGPHVGVAQLQIQPDGSETWSMVNGFGPPYTDNYGVDLLSLPGAPQLLLAGDRPGRHLMAVRTDQPVGKANMDTLVFGPPSPTETVRSLIMDQQTGNLYYWTTETDQPALYRCPPPYSESFPIHRYKQNPVILKAFQCHDTILMRDQRLVLR